MTFDLLFGYRQIAMDAPREKTASSTRLEFADGTRCTLSRIPGGQASAKKEIRQTRIEIGEGEDDTNDDAKHE
jgi:hypothetical protein